MGPAHTGTEPWRPGIPYAPPTLTRPCLGLPHPLASLPPRSRDSSFNSAEQLQCSGQGEPTAVRRINLPCFVEHVEAYLGGFNLLNKSFSDCTLLNPRKIHEHAGNRELIGKV